MHNCTIFDLDLIADTRSAGPAARLAPDLTEAAVEKVWRRHGEDMEKTDQEDGCQRPTTKRHGEKSPSCTIVQHARLFAVTVPGRGADAECRIRKLNWVS